MNCHALLCAVGVSVALSFACEAALPVAPAPYVPVNCIQRTMKALAESTPERPAEVRIAFYGQSIVAQGWTDLVVTNLQSRFPSARLVVDKRAIGGYQSESLSRTAEHDLYPFYPDLTFFHVYGSLEKYEEIVRTLRTRTTSEIVLWSSHVYKDEDPAALLAKRNARTLGIKAIAEKYHCHFIDLNAKWARMMCEQGLTSKDLLCDGVHLKGSSYRHYARFISEELLRVPGLSGESEYSGTIRRVRYDGRPVPFVGNRVVAVSSGTATAPVSVELDGRKPSSFKEMWAFTRPSQGPRWMPMVNRVESRTMPVAEDWTLTFLPGTTTHVPTNDVPAFVRYSVCGSVTGPDGTGCSTNDFVSDSGRVVIAKRDFPTWQFKLFKKAPQEGFTVTWRSYLQGADALPPAAAGTKTVLVQNCENGRHELSLTPAEPAAAGVRELIVHAPTRRFSGGAQDRASEAAGPDLGFEADGRGWRLAKPNWSVVDGVGRNGSRGLVCTCADTNLYQISSASVPFKPGQCFRITAWILNESLSGTAKPGFCVEFFGPGGNYLTGVGAKRVGKTANLKGEWAQYEVLTGPVPPAAATCAIDLSVAKGVTGRCVYDDFEVETLGYEKTGMFFSTAPDDAAFDGRVRFSATTYADLRPYKSGDIEANFVFEGEKGPLALPAERFEGGRGEVRVDVARLKAGAHAVRFCVKTKDGRELDELRMTFTHLADPPQGQVRFDENRRLIVDGRPTYPILVYAHHATIRDPRFLPAMKASPFRMVTYYTRKANRTDLDYFHENGIRAIAALNDSYVTCASWARPGDLNARDEEIAHTARIVQDVKDHPALLGWYLYDEPTESVLPRVRERYKLVKALDGEHLCLTVLCHARHARDAIAASDVIGLDCYPVPGKGTEATRPARLDAASRAAREAVACTQRDKPFWFVPQAYPHEPERARFPTVHELSSMVWQAVAEGADGILFYALNEMLSNKEKLGYSFDEAWKTTCFVAQQLRDHEEFLLSTEPVPTISALPEGVVARAWRLRNRTFLVAVNTTHCPIAGELTLDARKMPLALGGDDVLLKVLGH